MMLWVIEVILSLQGYLHMPCVSLTHDSDIREILLPVSIKAFTDLSFIFKEITGDSLLSIPGLYVLSSVKVWSAPFMLQVCTSRGSHW